MNDEQILALYFARDDRAVMETAKNMEDFVFLWPRRFCTISRIQKKRSAIHICGSGT